MNRIPLALVLSPWLTLSAWSQTTTPQPLSQLQQFLSLTDDQVKAILQNNSDYSTFTFQQQQQIQQAQFQIALETAKPQLDPMTIGMLYVGIETSCRSLRDKAATTQQQNVSVLTDSQKAKLNMLNDAIKLSPTIFEAESANLLGSPGASPFFFSTGFFSNFIISGFTSGSVLGGVSGCASPFPGNVIPINRIPLVAPAGTSRSGVLK
jgi:hypothetical protein